MASGMTALWACDLTVKDDLREEHLLRISQARGSVAEDALAPDVLQALGLRGHQIERVRSLRNRVQVVEVGDGWLEAASDPREAGRPAGY